MKKGRKVQPSTLKLKELIKSKFLDYFVKNNKFFLPEKSDNIYYVLKRELKDSKLLDAVSLRAHKTATHMPIQVDVTNADNIKSVLEEAINRYKRPPSTIVNCAGITRDAFILKMEDSDFDLVLNVNLKGTYLVMKHAAQRMIDYKLGGSMINISSVTARMGNMGQSNYAPSKAAVDCLSRVASKEFARYGIRVNTVVPGFINTPMTHTVPDKVKDMITANVALRRFGEPEEVSDTIAFLASDKSEYITGTSIEVSGGLA